MLSLAVVTIENDQYEGGIGITIKPTGKAITNVDNIRIVKKESNGSIWREIYTNEIADVNDLDISLFDILTVSGKSYTYSIEIRSQSSVVELENISDIECWFDGLFVGNKEKQVFAQTNCETNAKLNTQVGYVTTLKGRTPYRVSNAETCYYTGSSSGLFLKYTDDKKRFIPDYIHEYSTMVADFLTDGTDKVLKTHDGQIWYVSIDDTISIPFNEYYTGMNKLEFSWTEIGDLPLAWVVER